MLGACPLCRRALASGLLGQNDLAVAFLDGFPVNPGHTLIVPRRHVEDLFSLTEDERQALWALLPSVRRAIENQHHPDGYNVGVNVGEAAGQTVMHVHLHVIPRYRGDTPDPRGGVRWVVPERADYWSRADGR